MSNAKSAKRKNIFEVVFVDWSQIDDALAGIRSLMSAFEGSQGMATSSTTRKILFLDWRALKRLSAKKSVRLTLVGKYIKAYMLYENAAMQSLVYGNINWAHFLSV